MKNEVSEGDFILKTYIIYDSVYKTIHVQKVLYSFRPVMPIPSVAGRLFYVPLIRYLAKPLRSVAGKRMVPWPAAEFPYGGFE